MPEILKTGSPIDETVQGPKGKEPFIYSMRRLTEPGVRAVVDILLSSSPENPHVFDVGGGPGTYAEASCTEDTPRVPFKIEVPALEVAL